MGRERGTLLCVTKFFFGGIILNFSKIRIYLISALILCNAAFAMADGIPDPGLPCPTWPNGIGSLALFNLPDGGGSPFSSAQILGGSGAEVDATIEIIIIDAFGVAIPNFPAEDMWLESTNGGMSSCAGGTIADFNSNAFGFSQWAMPLRAGGFDAGTCEVMVNGVALDCGGLPFNLAFNSADINGDLIVNLVDVGLFSVVFYGAYDFSADFYADGVMNLADVGRLASGVGAACP